MDLTRAAQQLPSLSASPVSGAALLGVLKMLSLISATHPLNPQDPAKHPER